MSPPDWLRPLVEAVADVDAETFLRGRHAAPDDVRRSAVLVLFGESAHGPDLLLIERSAHLRSHAGQPAFPGGGIDEADGGPVGAALREAQEETGLDPAGVDVLAVLPDLWVPPSANVVTPVLAWWREPSAVGAADVGEVASVARVALSDLVDPVNRLQIVAPNGMVSPAFEVADMLVWGFTAGVLDRLLTLGGFAVPWDTQRVRDLPEETLRLARRQRQPPVGTDREP